MSQADALAAGASSSFTLLDFELQHRRRTTTRSSTSSARTAAGTEPDQLGGVRARRGRRGAAAARARLGAVGRARRVQVHASALPPPPLGGARRQPDRRAGGRSPGGALRRDGRAAPAAAGVGVGGGARVDAHRGRNRGAAPLPPVRTRPSSRPATTTCTPRRRRRRRCRAPRRRRRQSRVDGGRRGARRLYILPLSIQRAEGGGWAVEWNYDAVTAKRRSRSPREARRVDRLPGIATEEDERESLAEKLQEFDSVPVFLEPEMQRTSTLGSAAPSCGRRCTT